MYGTRNGKKRTQMQDVSNFISNVANSNKHSMVLQKIPLVEEAQSLRPRRGDRKNVAQKDCNENNVTGKQYKVTKCCKENNFTENICKENNALQSKLMPSMTNLKSNKASCIDSNKVPQKIPLTEVTETLRPRRGCKNNPAENNYKENKIPQSKSAVNKEKYTKTETSPVLKLKTNITQKKSTTKNSEIPKSHQMLIKKSEDNVSKPLPISGKDSKNKTASKSRILQSIQNFNLKSNNSESKMKNKRNAPLIQNGESRQKKHKIETSDKVSKDNRIMRKFPKWLSNGVESLRQGKKRGCNTTDVYDIETDKDLMFEKPVTKQVVKRAKITKTKKYPSKYDYHAMRGKNSVAQSNKNCSVKEAMGKFAERPHAKFEKSTLKTSERKGVSSLMEDIENSFNFQLFPMPQAASTPQDADKPNMAVQMLCSSFDATMLEIPQSQAMQVQVSDTEFLSIEEVVPGGDEIQLFESSSPGQRKQPIKGNLQKKHSTVKNLNVSLKVVESEHVTTRPRRACQQNEPATNGSSDVESSPENDYQDITLFDSPEKKSPVKDKSSECSPSKAILKKLFPEEFDRSPLKVVDVEEKVLKPRKSYHSPAQFRRYIVKAKKENKVLKKKKTMQEKLMEDLNNHFLEVENMELCIE
ncbi:hypothetical protein JTE90_028416 [Oedothorax gibbosus]|uniref:Tantalus-like domain-containing protein n=1 Tax=Oedothorax gibbosus TaxID=931172 RepID=A0AAV6VF42_9ARAC|nr:hypothetical protein JTE90_028416 [Oedothorax gibbosus]